ncbi:hypothetical protein TSOC_011435 [Tetrabaena socialis]|uniref:Uncharacterized protein n=1 Tax=Tetrabaena socialis TaxID=47790 RepID=A0A2J7ZQN8_9CHLO|nr:hypothetical protein TSOC_011435 [Tetrabaena socialis]|eukprot:PNH02577.1 hypothetical protein TSOC_011435 [Tetrabaena socialis]
MASSAPSKVPMHLRTLLVAVMPSGHNSTARPRPEVGPVPGPPEGIAVLWRAAALEAVAVRGCVFAEMDPRVAGLAGEVAGTEPWAKLRELGEGVVLAALLHRASGRLLVAACTHLFWNPAFPDVKALQPPLTNRTVGFAGCLDYVWFSAGGFAAASALAMPYDDGGSPPLGPAAAGGGAGGGGAAAAEGPRGPAAAAPWRDPLADIAFGAIPDQRYPSDHLAVGGELVLL